MAMVTPGIQIHNESFDMPTRDRNTFHSTAIQYAEEALRARPRERYVLEEVSMSIDGPLGVQVMDRTWRDTRTGNVLHDRVSVAAGEDHRRYYSLPPVGTEEHDMRMNAERFQGREHSDQSESLNRIRSIIDYFENSRRYSGMPREFERILEAMTLMYRELCSHHNHMIWLTNREPPRHDERFQQLELRLNGLEETIDLLTNEG